MRKGKNIMRLTAFILVLMTFMASCKPSIPSDVISKDKMESILYDYHIALAMGRYNADNQGASAIAYREAVLKKHEVTSAEFDSSMVYYMRHTELLHAIYEDLSDRLSKEAVALGGSANEQSRFGNLTSKGDTANVWNASSALVFSTNKPFNNYSFELKADTAYHKGDRLMLDFDSQFILQDGMRDGVAVLALTFSNDSVASQVIHIQNSQHYSIDINDGNNLGIKNVKGYFLLGTGDFSSNDASTTTLKLMFLQNIRLIRMHQHTAPVKPSNKQSADSVRKDSARRDSGVQVTHDSRGADERI